MRVGEGLQCRAIEALLHVLDEPDEIVLGHTMLVLVATQALVAFVAVLGSSAGLVSMSRSRARACAHAYAGRCEPRHLHSQLKGWATAAIAAILQCDAVDRRYAAARARRRGPREYRAGLYSRSDFACVRPWWRNCPGC